MATDRLIGHDLARYHVEAILGRGGMGVVYRAIDTRLGRTVALKVLSDERSADPDFRERFLRESRLLASIDHPNIVPIYEADEADGQLYIAMRYVPGPELRLIIADEAPMDAAKTVAIIGQVADALDAAHVAGLVHRDVKPGNILVMPGATSALAGHAYLTDFGLTKSTGSDTGLTKIGQFVGTPGYVAPEQIEGRGVDHRVDIYALGCILYNCLSGDVPYPRDSTVASLWAHLKEPPPRLSEHRKGLPKGLDAVITKALAKSPDERYQTCGALAQAARTALEETGSEATAVTPSPAEAATVALPMPNPPQAMAPASPTEVASAPGPSTPDAPPPAAQRSSFDTGSPSATAAVSASRSSGRRRKRRRPFLALAAAAVLIGIAGIAIVPRAMGLLPSGGPPTGHPPVIGDGSGVVRFDMTANQCASTGDCVIFLLDAVHDPDDDPVTLETIGKSAVGNEVRLDVYEGRQVARWTRSPGTPSGVDTFDFSVRDDHGNVVRGTTRVENIPASS